MPDEFMARVRAREIIKRLKLEKATDISIENIAWTEGALVVEDGLRGADARLIHTPGVTPAILRVNVTVNPRGRKRFAIAHELGHLKLNHSPGCPIECTEKEFLAWYKEQKNQEVEANIFAAELLLPEELFQIRLQRTLPSMELIEELAGEFQTTMTATAIRYVELFGERCALVYSVAGRIRWVRRSEAFGHWIAPGSQLSTNTYAADFFTKGQLGSSKMEGVRLDAWADGTSQWDTLKEQSRALPSYGAVLTLLWIP